MTLFPKIVVLLHRVFGTRLFVAQFLSRTATSNEINEQIQMYIEAAHHSADFNHSTFGAVAGLAENMGRGLRFLYAFELVLSPQDLETKVITIKRSKI